MDGWMDVCMYVTVVLPGWLGSLLCFALLAASSVVRGAAGNVKWGQRQVSSHLILISLFFAPFSINVPRNTSIHPDSVTPAHSGKLPLLSLTALGTGADMDMMAGSGGREGVALGF